jgi:hypothetical protein
MAYTWMGNPIDTLPREKLIEIINWLCREAETIREDRNAWMRSGSAVKYMFQKQNRGE